LKTVAHIIIGMPLDLKIDSLDNYIIVY